MGQRCRRCGEPATRFRLLRLGARQWRLPLCNAHALTLAQMIAGWVGDLDQDRPVAPPPRMGPAHPLSDAPRAVVALRPEDGPAKPLPRNVPPAKKPRPELHVVRDEDDLQERL